MILGADGYFLPLGGGNEIGASCYLLSLGRTKLLLDAGMRLRSERAFPDFSRLNTVAGGMGEIAALLLSHAHLDHCGALVRVHYEAPHLRKYATRPTLGLARVMLEDALQVSKAHKAEDWHIIDSSQHILDEALESFDSLDYGRRREVDDNVWVTPYRSGHVLGAASYLIEAWGRRVFYTGDICLHDQHTIRGMDTSELPGDIDLLIMESTYAYQPQYREDTIEEQQYLFADRVRAVIDRGGRVLVPAFALGRAQEIACLLRDLFEQGVIGLFDVIMDGLVKGVCDIYEANRDFLPGRLKTRQGHVIYGGTVRPTGDRYRPTPEVVSQLGPACIVTSSGMLMDGTRSARYAEVLAPNANDAILFSGYLDAESPGQRLLTLEQQNGPCMVNGQEVRVRATVSRYHLSAHAPAADLQRLMGTMKPRHVILVHGDYRYAGDASFIEFIVALERRGTQVHQSANGVAFYL